MWRSKHRSGMSDVHRHQIWSLKRQHVLVFHSWMHDDKEHQFTLRFHWFLCQAASWTYRSALDWRYDEYHHNAGLQWCTAMICHVSWHVLRSTWFQQTCMTLSCLFASWPGKSFLSNNGRRLSMQRGEEGSCRVSIFPKNLLLAFLLWRFILRPHYFYIFQSWSRPCVRESTCLLTYVLLVFLLTVAGLGRRIVLESNSSPDFSRHVSLEWSRSRSSSTGYR